jgi:nucleoid DNA-binding protein
MRKSLISQKSQTGDIIRAVAEKTGIPTAEVSQVVNSFWLDLDQMFLYHLGHRMYVERFGSFLMHTKNIAIYMERMEKAVANQMYHAGRYKSLGQDQKSKTAAGNVADLMTEIILVYYSVKLYKTDVLEIYPYKYKPPMERIEAVISRLEELFDISISQFPLTIHYPIQKVFVQRLRREGLLSNPVRDLLRNRRKGGKV